MQGVLSGLKSALLAALIAAAGDAVSQPAANTYPNRPIRLIVPQSASGMVDSVARAVAQHLGERLGQPLVVENRVGANGAIGFEAVARSAPDGYTLLVTAQAAAVLAVASRKSLPYDPLRDFTSVSLLFEAPYYLIVHPSVPARSVQELIDLARKQPGTLNYASAGLGSGQHLHMERFKTLTGTTLVHVPYKAVAQAGTDLLSGQIQVMLHGPAFTLPQLRAGKVRALAWSGAKRTQAMPDLPTIGEAGVPGYDASTWWGLAAPAGLPRPIVERLNRETGAFLKTPAVRERFAELNIELLPSTPEEHTERVRREIPIFAKVMRDAGIEPE
jgi:tripartite-type tricarboxylate transporter receptor subunit TctC